MKHRIASVAPPPVRNVGRLVWRITNVTQSEADIDLYDQIGEDWFGEGTSAADFIKELRGLKNVSRINLHINSPGGYVNEGLAMYNALQQHPAEVYAYIEGEAASAASFIAMAGDRVIIAKHANLFIHDAQGIVIGNASDARALADILDEESDNIAGIYADKTGDTVSFWRDAMRANGGIGTGYRGQAAVDAGLADEVGGEAVKATAVKPGTRNQVEPEPEEPEPESEETPEDKDSDDLEDLLNRNPPSAHGYTRPLPELTERLVAGSLAASSKGAG